MVMTVRQATRTDGGMRDRGHGPVLPAACGQALIAGRHAAPLCACLGRGRLRQAGPRGATALARLPLPLAPRTVSMAPCRARPGGRATNRATASHSEPPAVDPGHG